MKSKNVAAKKLCGGVVALKMPRKLATVDFAMLWVVRLKF